MRPAGRLTDRYGGGRVATIGTVVVAVSTLPLAWISDDSSYWFISTAMFCRGLGTALCGMPLMAAALRTIKPTKTGDASAQLFVLQRVGASLGTALFVVVLERAGSFGTTYAVVVGLTVLSVLPIVALAANEKRDKSHVDPLLLAEPAV
jgi:MFS family permease